MQVGRLNLRIIFHEICIFDPDNLTENSMCVEDVQVFTQIFFFNDPGRQLVNFGLFLLFFKP